MQPDDQELVERSKRGDMGAFNAIVERYQSHAFNVAARILGDRALAEDASQETFISAFRAIERFRGGSLRGWISRIATNRSLDFLRAAKRRPESSLDEALLDTGFQPPSPRENPEQEAIRGELAAEIQRAILTLRVDQRVVLVLVDVNGLSYEEAAGALGASLGTVKSRLSRARAHVRDYLNERGELFP